jgi:LPXTG-site transpeptidase (sortase) family protein
MIRVGKSPNALRAANTWMATLVLLVIIIAIAAANIIPASAEGLSSVASNTIGLPALPRSLWNDSAEPQVPNFEDGGGPIQLGTRFTSTVDGYVTGIRYFKGPQNTGTHTGQLYNLAGNLLASAVFTGETAAGWQTLYFSNPVFITAGNVYVTSYHTSSGFYARTPNYFTSARVNLPLTAPADDGMTNINGVYAYSATPTYPDQAYEQSNYWVDVVFETAEMPANGTLSVYVGTKVSRRFPAAMNPATINTTTFEARDPANQIVPATVTYDAVTRTAILTPASQLNNQTTYTVTILGGPGGVLDSLGNPLPGDITWTFTTEAGYSDSGPGGPILVIGSTYDGFSRYFPEILRAEGLNAFRFTDISRVSAATLTNYDIVILGFMTLSDTQAAMFTNWVTNGGNLITMRPDSRLASMLGITPTGSPPLSEGYLLVNGSGPGAGIVNQTIQYHGAADRYALSGATNLATLYATSASATASPAVTLIDVGVNGGQAAMFAYDLARSIVLTRQGNPRWSGDDRDGIIPTRSGDLFYGNKLGDPQPDWVDLNKVAIPQADEQQRLLANMILGMNLDKKPLPRFWYFPRDEKAIVVMTSDDHADNVVNDSLYDDRLDQLNSYDPPGCSVDDWECVRQTIYLLFTPLGFNTTPADNVKIQAYVAQGHEIAVHIGTQCADYTNAMLNTSFTNQMANFHATLPFLPDPQTERTHCVAWSNYVEHLKVRRSFGIRLDTNFYYHPASWVNNTPGLFTGSGLMMKFADLDGSLIDVYQGVTHMTDEAGQTYPYTINTLLDNALGSSGYYGAFMTNIHSDSGAFSGDNIAIIESALARDVPIVSALQMLTWLDRRNGSSFSAFDWQNDILSFRITTASGARGMRGMVPVQGPNSLLTSISRNGIQIPYRTETIKGVEYAFFDATNGDYQASYAPDTTPPVITNVQATINPDGTVTITWDTDEFATSRVDYSTNPAALTLNSQDSALTLAHSITLTGLTPNTTYHYRVTSADAIGNSATEPAEPALPLFFTTPYNPFTDTTVIDFNTGTLAACYVGAADNGELLLGPTLGEEFSGTGLPAGWNAYPWAGHAAVVAAGQLTADDAGVYYATSDFGPGHSLEFVATFGADDYQLAGFVGNINWNDYWAAFGTAGSTNQVNITLSGGTIVPIGNLVGAPHRYRIDRVGDVFTFYVDGVQVGSPAGYTPPGVGSMRVGVIDDEYDGNPLRVDWVRVAPYASPCTFTSRVFDAGLSADWLSLTWTGNAPTDTTVNFETRTGNSPIIDGSWSIWEAVSGTDMVSPDGRYAQYRVTLTTANNFITPVVESVSLTYSTINIPPTVTIDQFITQTDPTNASPILFTVVFSEPVTGFDGSDVLLTGTAGASTAVVTGSGATYILEVSGITNDGTVIASIPANAAQDSGGLGNLESTSTDNEVTYDTTAPTVAIEQALSQPDPTNTAPITFTITFSEPVTGFDAADVAISGTAGATTAVVAGSGADYTVTVSGMTNDGTVIVSLLAGAAQDAAGNSNTASASADNEVTYDATAPTVTVEQALGQADPTSTSPILFTFTFSEPVTGFDATDIALSGTAGATTVFITGSDTDYTVEVSGMTGDGTVIAEIPAGGAQDAAGNGNLASTSADNEVTYDTTPPTVTVEQAVGQPDPTNTSPINFTVTFSEPVTGFDAADVQLSGTAGATTTVVTGSGATYNIAISGMTNSGTVIASILAGATQDAVGLDNLTSTSTDNTVTYDVAPPTVTVEQALGQPDPTNASPILFTVTFSEPVTGFDAADVTLIGTAGATTATITGGGANYTIEVSGMTNDSTVIASILAGGAQDTAGNDNLASTSSDNIVTYDATAPTVTVEQALGQPDPTNASPILFTVTFSEPVTGFDATDIALTGTAGATTALVTGSSALYDIAVSGMANDGTVIASVIAGGAQDVAGNTNTASTSANNEVTYDTTPPTVTIEQALGQSDPANTTPINFTVVFSEPVTGFTGSDVALSGTAGATIAVVTGGGTTYNVAVSGMTGNGTVIANIPAGAAQDVVGLDNLTSTSLDNIVTYDPDVPTVTIEQALGQPDPTNISPILFSVTFSEPVTGFDAGDVVLTGTAGATTAVVTGSSAIYDVAVSGMTNDGTVIASIIAGAAQDGAGNASAASTSADNSVTYDLTGPTVTVEQALSQSDPTNASPINFTVTFSEPVTGFDATGVILGGTSGATTAIVTGSDTTYNVAVSGMAIDSTVSVAIPAGAAVDAAGNPSQASTSTDNTVTYDVTPPAVTVEQALGQADPTNTAPINFTVVFSEPVTGFDGSAVLLTGTAGATTAVATGSDTTYNLAVSGMTGNGTVMAAIPANAAQDAAGNGNTASTSVDNQVTYDALGPTVTVEQALGQADPTNASPINFTVIFSEPVTGFDASDVNLSGTASATTAVVTGSGTTYNVAVSGITSDGAVIASIPFGAAQDASSNDSLASTSTDNTVTYDTTGPLVSIGAPSVTITNSGPVSFPVAISGAASVNLTAGDITLNVTGTASGTVTVSDGASSTPTITVSGISGNGTLGISIAAGIAADSAGNSSAAAGPSSTFTVDNIAPTVVSINRADPSPTNAASVDFDVTFSESVVGLTAANFSLPAIGVTGASITSIGGSGSNYTVTVSTGAGDGTLGLNLINSTGLGDAAGNAVGNIPFTGQVYTVEKLNPLVLSISRAAPNPTTATSVTFTITFSKPVTGVSAANFALAITGVSGATLTSVTGSDATYTAVASTGTGNGTVGLNLTDATGVTDSLGNPLGNAPFIGEFYTIDLTPPTVLANGIGSLPDTGDGSISELEIVTVNVTQLLVRFNEDVNDPAGDNDANDVTNPANYLLVQDNGDGIQTVSCSAGVTGGDIAILIDSVTYDSSAFAATLNLNGSSGLANGVYRLIVCGTTSITDLAGNRLAGDGTSAQTDFTRNFIMAATRNVGGGGDDSGNQKPLDLTGLAVPATGFAPNMVTPLPWQPTSKAYAAYSGLVLEIPRLGIKLDIVGVPQTKTGWDVTWLGKQAGFLNGSAFPTAVGNSVITAHVWDAFNKPGPFFDLNNLSYGDKVIIRAWSKVFIYEVQSNARINPKNIAQVMKRESASWVTLVTCESFNTNTNAYTYRRMVRAILVSVTEEK